MINLVRSLVLPVRPNSESARCKLNAAACAHGQYSAYLASTLAPRPDYWTQAEMAAGVDLGRPWLQATVGARG